MVGIEGGSQRKKERKTERKREEEMGRSPCCDESGLKKGPWTPEEDQKLVKHIQKHGHGSWRALPKLAGLNRCGKSCRLRWTNYLRPDIKRGKFTQEEEQTILNLHSILGNKWSAIATHLPGRTDNEIKNFWNTHLKKKLIQMGFDPMTHRPRTDIFSSLPHLIALANLKELMMPTENHQNSSSWEELAGRLQSEAVQMAKLQYLQYLFQPQPQPQPFSNNIDNNDLMNANLLSYDDLGGGVSSTTVRSTSSVVQESSIIPFFDHMPHLEQQEEVIQTPPLMHNNDTKENMVLQNFDLFSMLNSSSSTSPSSPPPPHSSFDPMAHRHHQTEMSISGNSTPSYGGGGAGADSQSFWSELLLEDPLFHELA